MEGGVRHVAPESEQVESILIYATALLDCLPKSPYKLLQSYQK